MGGKKHEQKNRKRTSLSVSYTHLDVYKRQVLFLADRIGNYHVVGSSIKKEDNGNRRN